MGSARRIAVVGGGIGGLAAARALQRSVDGPVSVELFEAAEHVGGVVRSERVDGYLHEFGANGFLTNAPEGAVALARELGVPTEEASAAAKRRWIWIDGRLRAVPASPIDAVRTDLISWRGKLRVLAEPFQPPSRGGDESVAQFARRRLGPEIARAAVAPFVTGVFAGDAERLSLRAAFPKLAALSDRGGLVRGMVAQLAERRRSPQPRSRGGRTRTRLCAPLEGMGALARAVERELGDSVHLGARVERIERLKNGRLRLRGAKLGRAAAHPFDAVVLAVDAPAAAGLVRSLAAPGADVLEQIEFASAVVAYLGFPRSAIRHPMDGFGFLVAQGEALRSLGCVFESVLWSKRAPADSVLLRCVLGGVRDPSVFDLDDEQVLEVARRDIDRALGATGSPTHTFVTRHRRAIAQYTLGHLDRVDRAERELEPHGIVLAGSSYHGVGVNACIADAGRVVQRVTRHLAQLAAAAACAAAIVSSGACSGGASAPRSAPIPASSDAGDAGHLAHVDDEPAVAAGAALDPPAPALGELTVQVVWPKPDAELLRSPGRNPCGELRAAPLPVGPDAVIADRYAQVRTVAVSGAVVTLRGGVPHGRPGEARDSGPPADRPGTPSQLAPVELALSGCAFAPRVVQVDRPGGTVALLNRDEQRYEVALYFLGAADAPSAPARVATAPLPVIGSRVDVQLPQAGVYRAEPAGGAAELAYVWVGESGWSVVTDEQGVAHFSDVTEGEHELEVWYPLAGEGRPPVRARVRAQVGAGEVARATVQLGS